MTCGLLHSGQNKRLEGAQKPEDILSMTVARGRCPEKARRVSPSPNACARKRWATTPSQTSVSSWIHQR